MRKFLITVNGVSYEVEVEEVAAGTAPVIRSAVPAPVPAFAPAPVAAAAPIAVSAPAAPAFAPAAPKAAPAAGSTPIKAPMPGTVVDVKIKVGDAVKKGTVLLILEAMKMENEIMAPQDGTIAQIIAEKGSSVGAGDTLVTLA